MAFASNILDRLFEPFFGWNIAGTYQSASQFIDFVLYLIFFISVTRFALAKRFDAKTQKPITIIVGIVLAIGMSVFGRRWGFSIGDLAPLAGLLFLVVLGMMFFKLIKDMGDSVPGAGAFAFLLIFFSMTAIVPSFYSWIIQKIPFLEALLSIGVLLAVFVAIKEMIGLITGGGAKGGAKADEDMGIRDSREYLEKKARDKEKRRKDLAEAQAEKLRRQADDLERMAAAAKTPEEKKAYKEKADDKKVKADKKLGEVKEADKKSLKATYIDEQVPGGDKTITDEQLTKELEQIFGASGIIAKKQIEALIVLEKEIELVKKRFKDSNKEFKKRKIPFNYEMLPDNEKQTYNMAINFLNVRLSKTAQIINTLHVQETKDKRIIKGLRAGKKIKDSPLFESMIQNQNILEKKENLALLFFTYLRGLAEDLNNKKSFGQLIISFDKLKRIIKKLIELNKKQIKINPS